MDSAESFEGARGRGRRRDLLVLSLLSGGVFTYLSTLPRILVGVDEAHYLHYAKRVLAGDRIYKDFFDLTAPGWVWLMALSFRFFGTTLGNARVVAAAIQAAIGVLTYVACRQLGVRRTASVLAALSSVLIDHSYYFAASQHWLATLLCLSLLVLCLREQADTRTFLGCGLVLGALVVVHQGRGLAMVGGVVLFLASSRWFGAAKGGAKWPPLAHWALLIVGLLAVVAPVLLCLLASSGPGMVWDALVLGPLVNYRAMSIVPWGFDFALRVMSPAGSLIRFIPLALLPSAMLVMASLYRRSWERRAHGALALLTLGLASVWSIKYFPDTIHIAFISPLFLVAAAVAAERGGELLPLRLAAPVARVLAVVVVVTLALVWARVDAAIRARAGFRYASRFGVVDLPGPGSARQFDALRALVDAIPGRILYCHPFSGYTYLLIDASNPTRFDFVTPPQTTEQQQRQIIDRLESGGVPFVAMGRSPPSPHDQVAQFIRAHYVPLPSPHVLAQTVWRRG